MPRMQPLIIASWAVLAIFAVSSHATAVPGCPFCAPSDPPFSLRLSECDAAVEVKWVSLVKNELEQATTTFAVTRTYRTGTTQFKENDKITLSYSVDGKPGDLFLVLGQEDPDGMRWSNPISLSSEYLYAYVRKVPPLEAPDRLEFFVKFLEFPDPEICADAYAEFSRAQYKDVAALAPKMPHEKLRKWLSSSDPQIQVRLGLYGMMLGLGGDDTDAEFLEKLIMKLPEPDKPRFGIDGMMAGYVLLRGEKGLQKLVSAKFEDPRAEDDLLSLQSAIMFLWDYCQDRVPAESLRLAMRRFLDRPKLAGSVIRNLARWKDWESIDKLVAGYGKEPFDSMLSKQEVVAFALVCIKDGEKVSPETLPASAVKAQKFLSSLDPKFVKSVERSSLLSTGKAPKGQ